MTEPTQPQPMKLCLVCDDEALTAAVRVGCPPPNEVILFSMHGLIDLKQGLSERGKALLQAASSMDALLIAWHLDKAPVINTLSYHARRMMRLPIIALCRGHPEDQVAALAAGTDDALTFPLYLPLLQMKGLAYRRLAESIYTSAEDRNRPGEPPLSDAPNRQELLQFGSLRLDRRACRFYVHNEIVPLTLREFKLLDYLIENADVVRTRDQILDAVWGITFDTGTNMVDVYMYFLRKKLGAYGLKDMLQTVRGVGYRLTPNKPAP